MQYCNENTHKKKTLQYTLFSLVIDPTILQEDILNIFINYYFGGKNKVVRALALPSSGHKDCS